MSKQCVSECVECVDDVYRLFSFIAARTLSHTNGTVRCWRLSRRTKEFQTVSFNAVNQVKVFHEK